MDVADVRSHGLAGLLEERRQVEGRGEHADSSLLGVRPVLEGAIAIELDPVALGVGEVDRLGDPVVGRALELAGQAGGASHRGGKRRAVRVAEGRVEEPGVRHARRLRGSRAR